MSHDLQRMYHTIPPVDPSPPNKTSESKLTGSYLGTQAEIITSLQNHLKKFPMWCTEYTKGTHIY